MMDRSPWFPVADLTVSFAAGALLTWLLVGAYERRRARLPISDDVLRERVRACVAGLVSRPDAVEVSVEGGVVRLSGRVQPDERDELLQGIMDVAGVARVRNALATLGEAAL
jgi:osmotically-inducible protein OsmY